MASRASKRGETIRWLRAQLQEPTDECIPWPYATTIGDSAPAYFLKCRSCDLVASVVVLVGLWSLVTLGKLPEALAAKVRSHCGLPSPAMCRAIRESAGLTQEDVALALGVARETVCRWEAGIRVPRGAMRVAYLELLDELRQVLAE